MTLYASKGLEFISLSARLGRGFISSSKSIEEKGENGFEEERRLAYVGITRAKKIAKFHFL